MTTNDTTTIDADAVGGTDAEHDSGAGDRRQHTSADVAPELFG